jgi:hypothetical protein
MTKEELKQKITDLQELYYEPFIDYKTTPIAGCQESYHIELDKLLLQYVDDEEVSKLYYKEHIWYA